MTDLVASLRWIQENVSNFGGDPDRVMIYGQSGGGSKVTCLMGMPSTKGLIHRAGVQSGGGGNSPSAEQSKEFARQIMKELQLAPNDIGSLQKMDWLKLFTAGNSVIAKMNVPLRGLTGPGSTPSAVPRVGWGPTVDGRVVTVRSFYDTAPEVSKDVPMLIGSVSEEGMQYHNDPTEAEWQQTLTKAYGDQKAGALIAAMKKAHPEKAIRTLSYGVQGLSARNNVQRMVKLKHEQRGAPAYQYWFTWQSPQLDGVCGAWHTAELAFCFDNTKRCEQGTGNTPEAQAVAKKMSTAWANFAHNGDPSQPELAWTASDPNHCQTMIFDDHCRMADDPEGEARRILLPWRSHDVYRPGQLSFIDGDTQLSRRNVTQMPDLILGGAFGGNANRGVTTLASRRQAVCASDERDEAVPTSAIEDPGDVKDEVEELFVSTSGDSR